jgi:DNA-binding transcriptional MerR regulator
VLLIAWRFFGGSFKERTLTLEALKESVKALAAQSTVLTLLDNKVDNIQRQNEALYTAASRTMADVTTQRNTEFNTIRADIDVVPGKVGTITEVQIDTIRTALSALLAEQEARVGGRIDELADKYSAATLEIIRAEIEAMAERIFEKIDHLAEVVPEKVGQVVLTLPRDTLSNTQHALITSEQRAETQAQQIDVLKKRDTGPLTESPQPADSANPQTAEPGAERGSRRGGVV